MWEGDIHRHLEICKMQLTICVGLIVYGLGWIIPSCGLTKHEIIFGCSTDDLFSIPPLKICVLFDGSIEFSILEGHLEYSVARGKILEWKAMQ